ncbi:MAG: MotA/TolQ/ExbB proton channel family protein, partial [Salinisphaera sp.]|nr:MotA/TolQ/ExbB proton channel family protein [Salinisphaera sp.]
MIQPLDMLSNAAAGVLEFIRLGGPVVAILLAMSVLALAVIFLKLWQFARYRISDRRTAEAALKLYRGGSMDRAVAMARRSRSPAAQVLARAIRGRHTSELSQDRVREELLRFGSEQLEALRSHFR